MIIIPEKRRPVVARAAAFAVLAILLLSALTQAAHATPLRWDGGSDSAGWQGPAARVFFAEGTTRNGFEEYLVLRNPCSEDASVRISYLFPPPEKERIRKLVLQPGVGASIRVNDVVGPGRDVSIAVEAEPGITAERQMYFNYKGVWTGGHVTCGTTAPSDTWYFAEGTTRPDFTEWLCLQNPSDKSNRVTMRYMLGTGEVVEDALSLGPRSRETVDVNSRLGEGHDVSVLVRSERPIVAERPMYFDYHGAWRGGHTVTGSTSLSSKWYFAEGTTRAGFEEWLCIMNPGPETEASVRYLFEGGKAIDRSYTLRANARTTLFVNQEAGPERDVSIEVRAGTGILCERAMYFLYHGAWEGGHAMTGSSSGSRTWFLPSAESGEEFESWLCVANPNDEDNLVTVEVLGDGGAKRTQRLAMGPRSRDTVNLNTASSGISSPWVRVTGTGPLVCERPAYFSYQPVVEPQPFVFASCNGVELYSPIRYCDLLGCVYHEAMASGSDGVQSNAQVMQPVGKCLSNDNPGGLHPQVSLAVGSDPAYFIEDSRGRGSYSTTACDVQANAGADVYAPVTGTVLSAEGYMLYGSYPDLMVYILIDGAPGFYAAVIHMDSLCVTAGQRVEAGRTRIGTVRDLVPYFHSGPNPYTREEGNHAHVQVNYRPDLNP